MRRRSAPFLALALLLAATVAAADRVTVFAASSLKAALDEVVAAFGDLTGTEVVVSYGGSGTLAQQIIRGAPADVFISANVDWMEAVAEAGLIGGEGAVALFGNRLVLIGPDAAPDVSDAGDIPALLGEGRLALGQTKTVPAGIYARAALTELGLWDSLAPRLIETENVTAAARLVTLGAASHGIVYRSDVTGLVGVRVLYTFPALSHPAIVYPGAVLGEGAPAAHEFLDFLSTEPVQAIFRTYGFQTPPQ